MFRDFMDQEANPFHGQNPEDIFAHIFRDFNMTNAPQENVSKVWRIQFKMNLCSRIKTYFYNLN